MNKYKIGGVVTTFKPEETFLKNILSYLYQIDELLIFDNSPEKPGWLTDFAESYDNVSYIRFNENKGVAYALNYAASYFLRLGFDYLLTMDQDSIVPRDMITKMLSVDYDLTEAGILTPFFINKYNTKIPEDEPFTIVLFEKTSGNLLNLEAYKNVGPFDENLFIDYVDIDYCFKLNRSGYKVIQINSVGLIHNEAALTRKKILFTEVYPWNHEPFRWFYKIRNLFYLKDKYYQYFPDFFKHEKKKYIIQFIKILLYENKKISKFIFAVKGYYYYKKGKLGYYNVE